MKGNLFKRILTATIVTAVLSAAMAFSALAANPVNTENTVKFKKDLILRNLENGTYYCPNITYTFSVAPIESTTDKIVDKDDATKVVAKILPGPAESVYFTMDGTTKIYTGSIAYTSSPQAFTSSGSRYQTEATLNVDVTKFTAPGVYRYVLTDTTPTADLFAAGITRKDYINTLYLDLYIVNGDTVGTFKVGSAVLVTKTGDYGNTDGTVTVTKTNGFVTKDDEITAVTNIDLYRTVNIRVTKKITGDMADLNHKFPFNIQINNSNAATTTDGDGNVSNTNLYYYHGASASSLTAANGNVLSPSIGNNEIYYIRGLSPKAQINVGETNDTSETYKVTIVGKSSLESTASTETYKDKVSVAPTTKIYFKDLSGTTVTTDPVSDYDTANKATDVSKVADTTTVRELDFTNNCETISPTGVVLRFAPYAMMFGLGCLLLLGARRRREEEA